VTLGRPGRGPVRRDAVGRGHGDRGDRRHPVALESSSGGVEVEDLPSQRVQTRGRDGMDLSGTLAIAAVLVLLAAGFGILGGRRAASTPAAGARTADVATATAPAAFADEPQVTPDIPCAPPPKTPPGVQLEVGAQRTPGTIELLNWAPVGASASGSEDVPLVDRPERIEIRSDIPVELWIEGGACAVSWTIDVAAYVAIDVLQQVDNPGRIPGLASQNRFRLVLASHQGRTLDLRATLVFPDFTTRASWPIRVLPFTPPTGPRHAAPG
jgi:hypothetical protein